MTTMTSTPTAAFRLHRDRAHRATCKRIPDDAAELLGPEALQLPPATCCKPHRSAEWRTWQEVADGAAAEPTPAAAPGTVKLVYRDDAHPRAKHFWVGSGRDGAELYAAALGCELASDARTFTVIFTGARAAEAAELTALAWDAAAADLPAWRTSRGPDGYRGWTLRERLAADRAFMRSWHAGAAAELGAADQHPERADAAQLGAEWAASVR